MSTSNLILMSRLGGTERLICCETPTDRRGLKCVHSGEGRIDSSRSPCDAPSLAREGPSESKELPFDCIEIRRKPKKAGRHQEAKNP